MMTAPTKTLAEVARMAKVDISTASRVLRATSDVRVSPVTRQRILAAAEKLGFRPNALANQLRTGTRDLAIVLAEPSESLVFNSVYQEILLRLQIAFGAMNKRVTLFHLGGDDTGHLSDALHPGVFEGVIILGSLPSPVFERAAKEMVCLRLFHRQDAPGMNFFLQDQAQASHLVLDYLKEKGSKKVTALFPSRSAFYLERSSALSLASASTKIEVDHRFLNDSSVHNSISNTKTFLSLCESSALLDIPPENGIILGGETIRFYRELERKGCLKIARPVVAFDRPSVWGAIFEELTTVGIDYATLTQSVLDFFGAPQKDVCIKIKSLLTRGFEK